MNVVIAEDELVSGRLLESLLQKWGYEVLFATNGRIALDYLTADVPPSLAVLDWMMPEIDGIEVCRQVRAQKRAAYTYIILLTARRSRGDIVTGLQAGADDYITKPFDHEELHWRLRIGERILDLEGRLQRKLLQTAAMDGLTGVFNRRAFMDRAMREASQARRAGRSLGLILVDLDQFARVNEAHGCIAADVILQVVAERLQQLARPEDVCCRYDGDAFLVCCPGLDLPQTRQVAEAMREAVTTLRTTIPTSLLPVQVTASFGVAAVPPTARESMDALAMHAEAALSHAKSRGGNTVSTYV